jgi:hypothetical protein
MKNVKYAVAVFTSDTVTPTAIMLAVDVKEELGKLTINTGNESIEFTNPVKVTKVVIGSGPSTTTISGGMVLLSNIISMATINRFENILEDKPVTTKFRDINDILNPT